MSLYNSGIGRRALPGLRLVLELWGIPSQLFQLQALPGAVNVFPGFSLNFHGSTVWDGAYGNTDH